MGLSNSTVSAAVPVSDMDRATQYYEGTLGLSNGEDQGDGGRTYTCAEGTRIHVYPSPGNVGSSGATLAWWEVDDVEAAVDELAGERRDVRAVRRAVQHEREGIARMGNPPARGSC